jgi:hypothetical protein
MAKFSKFNTGEKRMFDSPGSYNRYTKNNQITGKMKT